MPELNIWAEREAENIVPRGPDGKSTLAEHIPSQSSHKALNTLDTIIDMIYTKPDNWGKDAIKVLQVGQDLGLLTKGKLPSSNEPSAVEKTNQISRALSEVVVAQYYEIEGAKEAFKETIKQFNTNDDFTQRIEALTRAGMEDALTINIHLKALDGKPSDQSMAMSYYAYQGQESNGTVRDTEKAVEFCLMIAVGQNGKEDLAELKSQSALAACQGVGTWILELPPGVRTCLKERPGEPGMDNTVNLNHFTDDLHDVMQYVAVHKKVPPEPDNRSTREMAQEAVMNALLTVKSSLTEGIMKEITSKIMGSAENFKLTGDEPEAPKRKERTSAGMRL